MRLTVVTFRTLACPVLLLLLAGDVGLGSQASAQTVSPGSPAASTSTSEQQPPKLPVDLGRIRLGVQEPEKAKIIDGSRLVFFAQTQEREPIFERFTQGFDFKNGRVPGAGMTHQEFLNMVTPKYLYSSSGISALEQLQWGVVNAAGWWTIKKLYKELSEARTEWRRKQIKQQIDRELEALKGR